MLKKIAIRFFIIVLVLSQYSLYAKEKETEDYYDDYERFVKVVNVILEKYVDEPGLKGLLHDAYKGMLRGLDPYSQFFEPEELEDLKIETEGEFEGIGIEVVIKNGVLTVITPLIDSPAIRAGILAGDVVIKINNKSTENMTIREVIKELRGKLDTEVTLTVIHNGETNPVDITIKRAKVQVKSVRGARIVDYDSMIGYLAITNFQDHTVEDFNTAINELKKQGMKSLVLDLRFNPGGLLNIATEIADMFLENGIIVSTKGRDKSQDVIYKAHKAAVLGKYPLIVLINNGSASAAEIVAGAIKDNKRGILLGSRTFGKGSVQRLLPIEDGKSALKLTTARYYTPSGLSIHEKGIEPDIKIELSFPEIKALHEHLTLTLVNPDIHGNVDNKKEVGIGVSEKFVDKQLEYAINILKGIQIYTNNI